MLTTGIFRVVKAVIIIIFVWLLYPIDRVGRRMLLLIGTAGGSVRLWIVGAYIKTVKPAENPTKQMDGGGIAGMFFFYLWTIFYTPTWNGTPCVLNSVSAPVLLAKEQKTSVHGKQSKPKLTYPHRKCSTRTCVPWHKLALQPRTGSGTS